MKVGLFGSRISYRCVPLAAFHIVSFCDSHTYSGVTKLSFTLDGEDRTRLLVFFP